MVHITLGYDDASSKEVMTGLLTDKCLKAGINGTKPRSRVKTSSLTSSSGLLKNVDKNFSDTTVGEIAAAICKDAGVDTKIPDNGRLLKTQSFKNVTPFQALNTLAQIAGFSLQAKDGKLWMGVPDNLGVTQTTPIDDGATSRPCASRGATATASPMDGQDFDIAGLPTLRPSDLVTLGSNTFRVQSITHKLTPRGRLHLLR